ncbi:MAG TPA: FemAB family XrtA/PEP-CTERM system-associated protein [Gemmatimonadaceae bacterium]|nr:FemAB family XrtA/PEP-CTERM system-associated protein [Gemmatimonadaceae bacterium]
MTLRVERYAGPPERWDDFVRSQPGWTHFHLHGWRSVMLDAMGHDTPYLVALDSSSDKIEGVLPLVRVKSALFGHFLVSVPFLNYGGPLGSPRAVAELAAHAAEMATDDGAKVLELRSRHDIGAIPDFEVSHRKITVLLDSSGGSDALWKRLSSKLRSQIRRPQKEGVTVRIGADLVKPFYRVFAHHMRDLGTPVMPRRFFDAVAREFGDEVLFAVAYHDDKPIACGAGFTWGTGDDSEFEITWASALRAYNRMAPNMLVYWELMKHVADQGINTFNFGRCTPGGNTHKFKTQWGTVDQPLWWYERRAEGAATPSEGHGAAARGPELWKRLPLPIANALGPRIIRFIP